MTVNRRSILQLGLPLCLGYPTNLFAQEHLKNKSCIFIWLGGGISHIEFTSPCPEAPVEYAPMTGTVKTNIEGIELGGTFTNLAQLADKFNIVRSFGHGDANHNSATHYVMTSHPSFQILDGAPQKEPCAGSIVSMIEGANSPPYGLPTYVKVSKITYDSSAWLGAEHVGYDSSKGTETLKVLNREAFLRRTEILSKIEKNNKVSGNQMAKNWTDLRNQASNVIMGKASEAFDLSKEDPKNLLKYNIEKSSFGQNLLTAKRLVERGTKFVSVALHGFDWHSDLIHGFQTLGKELDIYLSLIIQDIFDAGLSKDCLIIVASEFGRTPKINGSMGSFGVGRDHFSTLNSLLFAGGSYEQGRTIGKCDNKSVEPIGKSYVPFDLLATIFDHFGFDSKEKKIDNQGRPRYLLEKGESIL